MKKQSGFRRRLTALALALCMLVALTAEIFAADIVASGSCGTNLKWELDSDGTMTISGTGPMDDYSYGYRPWESYKSQISALVLRDGITHIGSYAFAKCDGLCSDIYIPDSVLSIGDRAFMDCDAENCDGVMGTLRLPPYMKSIGAFAFDNCFFSGDLVIPEGITCIEEGTFSGCRGFYGTITFPSTLTTIKRWAFDNCWNFTGTLRFPEGLETIEESAFAFCESFDEMIFPESLKEIGTHAFYSCYKLKYPVFIRGMTSIPDYMYYDCSGFTGDLVIPDTVKEIGACAFAGCRNLKGKLVIPESVVDIGSSAFSNSGFTGSLKIPESVKTIGRYAFSSTEFTGTLVIPNGVTEISEGTFSGCKGFTGVSLPDGLTKIGDEAFWWCTKLTGRVKIPETVTSIGKTTFWRCSKVKGFYFYGNAPEVWALDSDTPSFHKNIPLFYVSGKTGWTDSTAYNERAKTWNGYKLSPWDPKSAYAVEKVEFGEQKINEKGWATVFYRVYDEDGTPARGILVEYELTSGIKKDTILTMTDENGIFGVRTPEIEKDTVFSVKLTRIGSDTAYAGGEEQLEIKVKPLSYEQSWRGLVKAEGSAGLSGGAGISLGVTEFEATLGGASLKYGNAIAVELKESVDDGKVSREMLCTVDESVGPQFKSGIDAAVCKDIQVTAVGVSASAVVSKARTYGLYLENYDPLDSDQLLRTGKFILLCSYLPMRYSVLIDALMKKIDMGANEYTSTAKIALKAGASIGEVKIGSSDSAQAGGTVLASDCARSYTYAIENKMYAPILKGTCETKFEAGFGYGENLSSGTASMSGYIYGDRVSNSQKFSMTMDTQENKLKEIAYTRFCGDEKSLIWDKLTNDSFVTVAYQDEEAERFLASANMKAYSNGDLMSADVNDAIKIAEELQARGTAAEFNRMKQGIEFDVPFGVELGAKIKLGFGFSGEEAYTYPKKTATVYEGVVYETTESSATPQDVAEKKISLGAYIMTPVEAAIKELWESMKSAADSVVKGVKNGWAKVKGTVKGWFAEISVLEESDDKHESFAILSIMDETESIDDAVIAVTIGKPYAVAVYTDENKTQLVSDELLEENPITITLQYTDDMLSAAGANQASDIRIYRFDTAKNVYVCCMDSVKNTAEKTVTAKVTKQGEFILGVDTAGPLVSDVMLSNQTLTPTISAKVTDMSGIGSFSFWMDENADKPLVTDATLSEHYNEQTGVFTYTFEQPLTKGEHTAYFLASDSLGNKMSRPVTYQFTVSGLDVTFAELSIPDTVNSDTEKLHVQARTEENSAVSEMLVSIKNKDGTGSSYPMTLSGGVWYADIEVSSGNRTITVSLTAADKNGNVVRTEGKAVQVISSDSQKIQMEVLKAERYAGVTEITCNVSNNSKAALTGLLAAASYDSNGRMLSYGEIGAGVNAASKKTFTFDIKTPKNAVKVKLFLLDITHGSKPICAAAEGMIR